jgi:hypothetical protein
MLTITSVVLAFVLTGVVGNHLIHALQHRNWVSQQKVLGLQRDYDALRVLFEEISQKAGKRLARMQRLALSLRSADLERLSRLLKEYDDAVREWNESFGNLCVRTTFHTDYFMTSRLETEIQARFYEVGRNLEALVRLRKTGALVAPKDQLAMIDRLNSTQGVLNNFSDDMLRLVKERQARTFDGVVVEFNADQLDQFSTWYMLKALFVRAEERLSIVRSPSDLPGPFDSR